MEEPDHGDGSSADMWIVAADYLTGEWIGEPRHRHDRLETKKSRIRDENRLTAACGVLRGPFTAALDRMVRLVWQPKGTDAGLFPEGRG